METRRGPRPPLTPEAIVTAAVDLADSEGIGALSMRAVARRVGVEAMSLYHHVATKERMLDGMVDLVFSEIHAPRLGWPWRAEVKLRSESIREALLRHRWAVGLMDSRRAPGPDTLRHHDAVLGCLRTAGFSLALTGHAVATLDAHVYGFCLQEISLPFEGEADLAALGTTLLAELDVAGLPHFVEYARDRALLSGYSFAAEFDWGLQLILDGIERDLTAEGGGAVSGATPPRDHTLR